VEGKELAGRHGFAADVAAASAPFAVVAAKGDQHPGRPRTGGRGDFEQKPLAVARGERGEPERLVSQPRVANLIQHHAGPVASLDHRRFIEPEGVFAGKDGQTQVAAAARQVEREFRAVAGIHTEGRRVAVKRAVETFRAVGDDEITPIRPVAQRAVQIVLEHRADAFVVLAAGRRLGRHLGGKDWHDSQQRST
jgi:hypothetical protein